MPATAYVHTWANFTTCTAPHTSKIVFYNQYIHYKQLVTAMDSFVVIGTPTAVAAGARAAVVRSGASMASVLAFSE